MHLAGMIAHVARSLSQDYSRFWPVSHCNQDSGGRLPITLSKTRIRMQAFDLARMALIKQLRKVIEKRAQA